jgi:hypothetical protein
MSELCTPNPRPGLSSHLITIINLLRLMSVSERDDDELIKCCCCAIDCIFKQMWHSSSLLHSEISHLLQFSLNCIRMGTILGNSITHSAFSLFKKLLLFTNKTSVENEMMNGRHNHSGGESLFWNLIYIYYYYYYFSLSFVLSLFYFLLFFFFHL